MLRKQAILFADAHKWREEIVQYHTPLGKSDGLWSSLSGEEEVVLGTSQAGKEAVGCQPIQP